LAQVVWQVSWFVVQFMTHVVLAAVLGPGACAANTVDVVEPIGGVLGTKQAD
jgi:hypothetical protein